MMMTSFFSIKSYFPNCNFMVVLLFTVFSAVYKNPDPYSLKHFILLNGDPVPYKATKSIGLVFFFFIDIVLVVIHNIA